MILRTILSSALGSFALLWLATLAIGSCQAIEAPDCSEDDGEVINEGVLIRRVVPAVGPLTGNTLVTLAGAGFNEGNLRVLVDGRTATGVEVIDDQTLLFRSPPSSEVGVSDITVYNNNGFGTRFAAFRYTLPLAITTVEPAFAKPGEAPEVHVYGQGFAEGAGELDLRFDGISLIVEVIDDNELVFTAPERNAWTSADIVIAAQTGTVSRTGAFHYVLPGLLAGDALSGGLYHVDPGTGAIETIRLPKTPAGTSGLAANETGLYAAHAGHGTSATPHIARISLDSDDEDIIVEFREKTNALEFDDAGRLIAPSRRDNEIRLFDPMAPNAIEVLDLEVSAATGNGVARGPDGSIFFAPDRSNGALHRINTENQTSEVVLTMDDLTGSSDNVKALAFLGDTLFMIRRGSQGIPTPGGPGGQTSSLLRVDLADGRVVPISSFGSLRIDAALALPVVP